MQDQVKIRLYRIRLEIGFTSSLQNNKLVFEQYS